MFVYTVFFIYFIYSCFYWLINSYNHLWVIFLIDHTFILTFYIFASLFICSSLTFYSFYHANRSTLMFVHLCYPHYQRCSAEGKPLPVTKDKKMAKRSMPRRRKVCSTQGQKLHHRCCVIQTTESVLWSRSKCIW